MAKTRAYKSKYSSLRGNRGRRFQRRCRGFDS